MHSSRMRTVRCRGRPYVSMGSGQYVAKYYDRKKKYDGVCVIRTLTDVWVRFA